jgi:hypothetical protein
VGIIKPGAIPSIVQQVDKTIGELREEVAVLHHLRKHLERTIAGKLETS